MKHFAGIFAVVTLICLVLTGCAGEKKGGEDLQLGTGIDPELESCVEEAAALLRENGRRSEEIWPGYTLDQNAIILCLRDDETNKVVRAWKLTTEELAELQNEDLAGIEIPAAGSYSALKFEGRKSIIIAVNAATIPALQKVAIANFIYEVGTHEMVHLHYESPFQLLKLAKEQEKHGGRGTAFPKAAEPRVYRKMLYDNLTAAFDHPDQEETYLSRAKYWLEKWKTDYPGEYYQIKVTDVLEGKARYIQYMLCMPGGLSEEEQAAWISARFDRDAVPAVSMDAESYRLGFAAGVILDRREPDWKTRVKGEPITEYLLKNVEAAQDGEAAYEELLKISEAQMAQVNEELSGKLENIRLAEADRQIPFLQMSEKTLAGSYETSGFLKYNGSSVTADFAGTFEGKSGTVQIRYVSVYEENKTVLLPLTMAYELADGRLTINAGGVTADIRVKQTTDRDGRTVYVMK